MRFDNLKQFWFYFRSIGELELRTTFTIFAKSINNTPSSKMKRYHSIRVILTAMVVMLATASISAQPLNVRFDKTVHDFGDLILNSGKQTAIFKFTNISSSPVTIQQIINSCGCTTTNHTKSPIMPGGTGEITAVYSNDEGAYPFDKALTVYISGETKPVILRLRGVVHDKKKSLKELYPQNFNGFAMRTILIDLGDIDQGNSKSDNISVANISTKPITVSFSEMSSGIEISPNPLKINANSKADLTISLNTKKDLKWGNSDYKASVSVDNQKVSGKNINIKARIKDNFAGMSKEEMDKASLPMANASSHDFGSVKKGEVITHSFSIRNIGTEDLTIHKIESSIAAGSAINPKTIKPNNAGSIEVKINTSSLEKGEIVDVFTLYTNSPKRPMIILIVSGTVN